MCLGNSFVWVLRGPTYQKQPVPCRSCWQCRTKRRNDYVGRMMCEASVSDRVAFVTLTYAKRKDMAEYVLTPSHFQTAIRALRDQGRKRGFSVRYFVAGEYGGKRGRAHFHAILFFKLTRPDGRVPTWKHCENDWDPVFWGENGVPIGHLFTVWEPPEEKFSYVAKYCLKDQDAPGIDARRAGRLAGSWISMSKKPSLGHDFMKKKAMTHFEHGVWPRSFEYQAPGGRRGRKYSIFGATRRDFLVHLRDLFGRWPDLASCSEWMRLSIEKVQRLLRMQEAEEYTSTPEYAEHIEQQAKERIDVDAAERRSLYRLLDAKKTVLYALFNEHVGRVYFGPSQLSGIRKDMEWLKEKGLIPGNLLDFNPARLVISPRTRETV